MQQILIATTNPGKIATTKKILSRLDYEGVSFSDLGLSLEAPAETATTAEEIAKEKALGYLEQFHELPVIARDDTCTLVGVAPEDDPRNHNKEFIKNRAGTYSDSAGENVFAAVAHKYGGSIPIRFDFGYALAWRDGGETKVVFTMATTDPTKIRITDQVSESKTPGFSFAAATQVLIDGQWKYDTELTEAENWAAYWNLQMSVIHRLIERGGL